MLPKDMQPSASLNILKHVTLLHFIVLVVDLNNDDLLLMSISVCHLQRIVDLILDEFN